MAKKGFSYQGKTLDELQMLSITELAPLLPSRIRRKIKRGFTEQEKTFLKRFEKKGTVKTHCRDMIILPVMAGRVVKVYKGNGYDDVHIVPEMIGHRLGEFAPTRKKLKHGAMGIGASRSSANVERK